MAAISAVAWKTARSFPLKSSSRVLPSPPPSPGGRGGIRACSVENGAAFSTEEFIARLTLTPALSRREKGGIRACSVENGAAFSTASQQA